LEKVEPKENWRIIEHNQKAMTKQHIDQEKAGKKLGEEFRRITAIFTDKEIDEASYIGIAIANKMNPEDGFSYEEIASALWGDDKDPTWETLPEEYRKDDAYISKIDRLLYVLQNLAFKFMFNTTIEPEEKGERRLSLIPYVKSTNKIKDKDKDGKEILRKLDEPVKMIFNAAGDRKLAAEQLLKSGIRKTKLPTKGEKEAELIVSNLKGQYTSEESFKELERIVDVVMGIMQKLDYNVSPRGIEETEMMHRVLPESIGKEGKDLEPYIIKFNDALYLLFRSYEPKAGERNTEWKINHGYLEGR
jgi:hypothetical protein